MDKDTPEQFDETAYRDKLISLGTAPDQAASVAAKMALTRRGDHEADALIAEGFKPDEAQKLAAQRKSKRNTVAQPRDLFDDVAPPAKTGARAAAGEKKAASQVAPAKTPKVPVVLAGARVLAAPKATRTKRDAQIITASAQIADAPPSGDDMAFMHALMCQVGLPRSKVAGLEFERQCGNAALSVSAGKLWDGKQFVQQPIPYGALPRLMLGWMNTFAVRHKTPEVPVGNSAAEFLRILGKDTSGGKKGGYTMFRKQISALSACRMTLGFNAAGKAYTYDGKPIKQFEAWLNNTNEQPALWPGVVVFSEDYYKTLIGHAVPLDVRALSALKGSALAMDIYCMLADRLHRITGRPVLLYWANLREQFGQEYQGKDPDKDFKKKFLPALRDALAVYPQAQVKQVTGGLLLLPSPPPIPYKAA